MAMSQWYFWYWNWAILERLFPAICSFWLDGRSKHTPEQASQKDIWSTLQAISGRAPLIRLAFTPVRPPKIASAPRQLGKLG
jgi:hypothetical protein